MKILKLHPELISIPIAIVSYIVAIVVFRTMDETIPMIDLYHWLAFPFALLSVFFANFLSYTAIKYNRPDLWEQYKNIVEKKTFSVPSELNYLWWRYYVTILSSVFLSLMLVA